MKKLLLLFMFILSSINIYACHALALQNYNITVTGNGVEVDAESQSPTCGCGDYWMDVEIRCTGEPFDGAPFDPTQYLSLDTYPYFQSATMLKPNCVVESYPTVTIPFTSLCPGVDYQVRARENNNGTAGPWTTALTFTAPGNTQPLQVELNTSEDTICNGDCTIITPTVTGGCDLSLEYSWSNGSNNSSINVCPTNDSIFDVTVTEVCSNTSTTESIEIIVYDPPYVDFEVEDNCLGNQSNITPLTNHPISNWDFGNGDVSNTTLPIYTYPSDGNYTITLSQESIDGCVNDTTKEITIFPNPEASFNGYNLSDCSPLCFNIESDTNNITQHIWTFSNGNTYNGDSISDCITNNTPNEIYLSVTLEVIDTNNCRDTLTQPNYLQIYRNPIADFESNPSNPDILSPNVFFSNLSEYSDYYTWTISGNTYNSYNLDYDFGDNPGEYNVELISYTDYCSDTTNGKVIVNDILLFYIPNTFTPDGDGMNETFKPIFKSGFDPYNYNLTIYNRWGEILFESNNTEVGWDGRYDNKIVKNGTYIWKVRFKESMSDKRYEYNGHVNILK